MRLEIKVPSVGESISSAEISEWLKKSGDFVKKGEILVVLETDKASMDLPAEQSGQLEILKDSGEVLVDENIGFIEIKTVESSGDSDPSQKEPSKLKAQKSASPFKNSSDRLSPAVKRLVESHKLKPLSLQGSGKDGRLTKADILKALNSEEFEDKTSQSPADFSTLPKDSKSSTSSPTGVFIKKDSEFLPTEPLNSPLKPGQRREKMSRLRWVTAKRLVQSQQNSASLSTFNEVDLSRIIEIRKNHQKFFIEKWGFKLGFMSFFVKSVVSALKAYPKLNAFIEGENIIYNDFQHIGIAVSTDKGLVVPVLFHAEKLSLAQVEQKILGYKEKSLAGKLSPDDLLGGTFTISNGGVFGSLLSTPLLNPPQSGILGMHKIQERPIAINGSVLIRPMMYLTLSYDHRIVDGKESVSFLLKVKEGLEDPSRLLIDL